MPRLRRALVLLALAAATLPRAAAAGGYHFGDALMLDHRGQWGVAVEPVYAFLSATEPAGVHTGSNLGVDLVLSHGLADTGDELAVRVRALPFGAVPGVFVIGGYRTYFGLEHWKTYADLDLLVPIVPGPAIGGRVGLGLMYDPSKRFGVSVSAGAYAAVGVVFVTGFDALVGAQLRF